MLDTSTGGKDAGAVNAILFNGGLQVVNIVPGVTPTAKFRFPDGTETDDIAVDGTFSPKPVCAPVVASSMVRSFARSG